MLKKYLFLIFFILLVTLTACAQQAPTAVPFATYTAQNVLDAFERAGLDVTNPERDMLVGRDAPATFSDRYVFEIGLVAPQGGQILVFSSNADMQAWRDYIESLRASTATRRDVVYVYENANIMVQINANLPVNEANRYRDAVASLGQ
jgi:hypothetical protein